MNVVISRKYQKNETIGTLFVLMDYNLLFTCRTIELPNLGNQKNCSCIPAGTYDTVKYDSPNKGMVFLLKDVPGRESIEIHAGNYINGTHPDSKGCILCGTGFEDINEDGFIDVIESRKTLNRLLGILPSEFKLIIIDDV